MKIEGEKDEVSETFIWKVDLSEFNNARIYSDIFTISGFKWRIFAFAKLYNENPLEQLSMYLGVVDPLGLPIGWRRPARFSLTLINQLDSKKSITKSTKGTLVFDEKSSELGFKLFMPVSELHDKTAGYLVSNMCIIEAKVAAPIVKIEDPRTELHDKTAGYLVSNMCIIEAKVAAPTVKIEDPRTEISSKKESKRKESHLKSSGQSQVFSAAPKTISSAQEAASQSTPVSEPISTKSANDDLAGPSVVEKLGGVTTSPSLIEFRGLGLIDEDVVPLLEEVCSWHPELIECQKNRTRTFSECAFTSFGKLLHILKTTKVKDMTVDKFVDVQKLWDELEVLGFDLAWLKAYIQSRLGQKNFIEMSDKVLRLREHVDELKAEVKRQKTILFAAEVDLEIKRRDLAETEELDLNSELGYGRK